MGKIKYNEVTWYSKLGAIILFLGVLPVITFYIGEQFNAVRTLQSVSIRPTPAKSLATNTKITKDDPAAFKYAIAQMTKDTPLSDIPVVTVAGNAFVSCGDIAVQQGMNECFAYEAQYYSNELETTYKQVAQHVSPTQLASVKASISNLRTTICNEFQGKMDNGSMGPMIVSNCESYLNQKAVTLLHDEVLTNPITGK